MATLSQVLEIKPGLLLTHDWSQLRTEKALCDTTITKTDGQDFKTVTFPITRCSQYEAFVSGQVLCQDVIGCPLQSLGNFPDESCHDRPISAVVKVIYQVTHTLSADENSSLSAEAITSLRQIDNALGRTDNIPTEEIDLFLQTHGSHFQYGSQPFGRAFSWTVCVEEECDMELLREVANEIVNQELVEELPASKEGCWYSAQNLLNPASWSSERQKILKSIKLRASQCGSSVNNIGFQDWKSTDKEGQAYRVDGLNTNLVSLWDLIEKSQEEFQNASSLKAVMEGAWRKLVDDSRHQDVIFPECPEETIPDVNASQQKLAASRKPQTEDSPDKYIDPEQEIGMPTDLHTVKSQYDKDITPEDTRKPATTHFSFVPPNLLTHEHRETIPETGTPSAQHDEVTAENQQSMLVTPKPLTNPDAATPETPETMSEKNDPMPEGVSLSNSDGIPEGISQPWKDFIKALGMAKYFPGRLSLQEVRKIHVRQATEEAATKEDLPWRVLDQLMLTNSECREDDIYKFSKTMKPKEEVNTKRGFGKRRTQKAQTAEGVPHPMDMILLLFTCSDYMLRQVLARKLFMCRLAIPFIIPTTEDKVEMMLWPLRAIILEWRNAKESHEEALLKCEFNMIAFMRYGDIAISKSSLMNDVLSSPSHETFFHRRSPCGNVKRLISNGTVEMSHFLPRGSKQDIFKYPALFFNLRGNACDYPVQHSVLLDLATVLVVFVDIGELHDASVQKMLKLTDTKQNRRMCFVLTDSKRHYEDDIEELYDLFCETVGDSLDEHDLVITFDTEFGGGTYSISTVIQDVRNCVSKKLLAKPPVCLEQYLKAICNVDEVSNSHCSAGKELANRILTEMRRVDYLQRKKLLLPKQGPALTKLGELLREQHRYPVQKEKTGASDSSSDEITKRDRITSEMDKIRMKQATVNKDNPFMGQVIGLLKEKKETRDFAMRLIQLELDAISRECLPKLQRKKADLWEKAKKKVENEASVQNAIKAVEEDIYSATFGWEHLMREIGQEYEVQAAVKDPIKDVSFLADLVGRQLLEGHPVELMDGDHGVLPLAWVKAVFQSLSQLAGERKRIFVVSVVGIQSSGKSTMLNTMFGLEFAVSAGRCTRGIYAQLLPVKENQNLRFDYLLVLDSEGLRSQQRDQNYQHDNELATLVIGLSDIALVNMKGENVAEMVDVLQIVVHAFLRMKLADSPHKRRCIIIHQNIAAVNAQEKLADDRQKLEEKLNTMTREASMAQGLAECITSFNRIIGFDSTKDVIYFSDLWNGDPPMATINQGYSHRAAGTQQRILKDIQEDLKNSITIPNFIARMEDMWKGVLSDDFIFSFRNTLAAKAYIEVEREVAAHTFDIEQKVLEWVNTHCKVNVGNCQSEKDLHDCCRKLKDGAKMQVHTLVTQKVTELQDFFENHSSGEIIDQWKSEKVSSLRTFGETQEKQTELDLKNMKNRKLIELHQKHASETHEKAILNKAIALAESMRGEDLSEEELQAQFDELWEDWSAHLPTQTSPIHGKVMHAFQDVLWKKFSSEGGIMFFQEQIDSTPLQASGTLKYISIKDIDADYVTMKGPKAIIVKMLFRQKPIRSHYFDEASQRANQMMETVMQRVEKICTQDTQFQQVHGREVIDLLWEEIARHNDLPFYEAEYAMTPQFKAFLAVRVASCAIAKFEQMDQRFEEQYGVEAQMKKYKSRMFRLFLNTLKQVSDEVITSEDFCEALKSTISEYIHDNVKQNIPNSIKQDLGNIKFDLIIRILREIAEKEKFASFSSYAVDPACYAETWLTEFCKHHLFHKKDGMTKFADIAGHEAGKIFSKVVTSAKAATEAVSNVDETKQYTGWIEEFCSQIKDTIPMDPKVLSVATGCKIENFINFQKFIERDLQKLQTTVEKDLKETTAQSAQWLDTTYQKIFQRMWGCCKHCPFCKEPCQKVKNHQGPHMCVQHKPSGARGISWASTSQLCVETCNCDIASTATFRCGVIEYKCRENGKCNGNDSHKYRDYKTYLPDWDIVPDSSGESSKYWQWAMCKFQKELLDAYPNRKLEIPASWKNITKQEAIDSLNVYQ